MLYLTYEIIVKNFCDRMWTVFGWFFASAKLYIVRQCLLGDIVAFDSRIGLVHQSKNRPFGRLLLWWAI